MPTRHRHALCSRDRSRSRAIVRALICVVFAALAFSSRAALASMAVPMCGVHAQTVAAPPISRAAPEIPLAPSNCDARALSKWGEHTPTRSPASFPHFELTPRLAALHYRLPPVPRERQPLSESTLIERPGFASNVERPPRRCTL
jgi:hypothetical protein